MKPLKELLDEEFIQSIEHGLKTIAVANKKSYSQMALTKEYENMELKERIHHLADCLHRYIPGGYPEQVEVVKQLTSYIKGGLEGTVLTDFVEHFGQEHWDESMLALEHLTQHSTGEFAIRPYLIHDLKKGMNQMTQWSSHANYHVRRFASEGCRPRLPWGKALTDLKKDPTPIFPILEVLLDDESDYVTRSVANNLNDISKDHPELVIQKCQKYLKENSNRQSLVKHALRGLLKQPHPKALELFGYSSLKGLKVNKFELDTEQVPWEGEMNMYLDINTKPKKLRIEFVVDYMKSNGKTSPKVFQWIDNNNVSSQSWNKKHVFLERTTRKHYPGKHQVHLRINGVVMESRGFELLEK
ncbi:MAG: DNA alkylation repair protein [Flavobacteriales bacterium]|nr:DNA alkylation repair protein [Flavobacteriales bacterium]